MEENGKLAIAIVIAAVGVIGLAVAIIYFLRYSRRRKLTPEMFTTSKSETSPVIHIKFPSAAAEEEQKLPITITSVPTQVSFPSKVRAYPKSTPDPLKLVRSPKVEEVTAVKATFLTNLMKKGNSYDTLINECKEEQNTEISKKTDQVFQEEEIVEDAFFEKDGDTSPECLPEQWSTPTFTTTIEFTVTYVNSSGTLAVHIKRLKNLPNWKPFKSTNNHRIKIKLRQLSDSPYCHLTPPTSTDSPEQKLKSSRKPSWGSHSSILNSSSSGGQTMKKDFDFENGAILTFSGYELPDLKNYYMQISLYELKFKSLREKLIGECISTLAQLELGPDVSITCMENVQLKKKKSSFDKLFLKTRGQLFISLYYQFEANRMKVLVRKATDLPKMKLPGIVTEYGVMVNSIYGGSIMVTQETKKVHGRSPVWNQPFIFDIPEKKLEKYSLQFIAFFSIGMNQPHHTIGHAVIGPDVRGNGHDHWMEAIKPKSLESTYWHKLQPMQ